MLRPPLKWIAPTHHTPKNHKNRGNMVTNKPTLYSSFARAHLLFAWDIVAAIIGLCIYKLCLTSHTLWFVGVWFFVFSMKLICGFCVQHLCVVFVFSMTLICRFLFLPTLYLDYLSLISIFHAGMCNQLWYAYELFIEMPQWV